jgi:hypothetical protein
MAVESYVQCRLTEETHTRLRAFLERLKAKARASPGRFRPSLTKGKVGLSDAIDELLYFVDREEGRKASYSRAKTAKRRELDVKAGSVLRREADKGGDGSPA